MNKCLSDQTSSEVANLTGSEANNFMGSNLKNYGLRRGEKEFIVTVGDIDNMVCFNLMQLAHPQQQELRLKETSFART